MKSMAGVAGIAGVLLEGVWNAWDQISLLNLATTDKDWILLLSPAVHSSMCISEGFIFDIQPISICPIRRTL